MQIQDPNGIVQQTTIDRTAIVMEDLQEGDVFSFYNDSSRQVFIMGEERQVISIGGQNISWNDQFIDASRARVIWYKDARLVLGQEYTEAGNGRGKSRSKSSPS